MRTRMTDAETDYRARRDRENRRQFARRPKKIADVLAQLITQRNYGRVETNHQLQSAWQAAAGEPLAKFSRAGRLRRGKLEIFVSNSTIMQELGFQKQRILSELRRQLPEAQIADVRFRVGAIS